MEEFNIEYVPISHGSYFELMKDIFRSRRHTAILLFQNEPRLLFVCALKFLMPFITLKVISLDFISLRPNTLKGKFKVTIKKLLLKKANLFLLHVKESEGYRQFLGIDADRMRYVPILLSNGNLLIAYLNSRKTTFWPVGSRVAITRRLFERCKTYLIKLRYSRQSNNI